MSFRSLVIASLFTLAPLAASAQYYDTSIVDRMNRMERDMNLLQQNVYRGGGTPGNYNQPATTGHAAPMSGDTARLEVRLTQLEEQMRGLTGTVEEIQFAQRRLDDKFKALSEELAYQQQQQAQAAVQAQATPAQPVVPAYPNAMVTTPATTQPTAKPSDGDAVSLYNKAYTQLNAANYPESIATFQQFMQSYPSNPLVGNAYYWMGEAHYAQKDYAKAADAFGQGYKKLPTGPKAPDNLLRLGMTLGVSSKTREACVVLSQLLKKHPDAAENIRQQATKEQTRLGCQ
jgi:tol-pal system protein YbgF